MSWSQADVDSLKRTIASGQLTWQYGERKVTYQDINSMLRALAMMEAEVAAAAGPVQATHRYTFTTLRGA